MSIRRILVSIPASADPKVEIDLGLAAATLLEAHLEALFITGPDSPASGIAAVEANRTEQKATATPPAMEQRERRALEARLQFAQVCGRSHVPLVEPGRPIDNLPSASWSARGGDYAQVTVRAAVAFDLVIAGSATASHSLRQVAETVLLQTRRPVILAPLRLETSLNDLAVIAWDESPQCWHAVTAAVPFLQRAGAVEVISIDSDEARRRESQDEVITYLSCHGVAARARTVAPDWRSIGEALLAEAGDRLAGLLVMGAYSHSRVREMLLGGATRHVLENASATPVLMAH
jgi:nucleotide-binding universal stress UspA family protein